MSVLKYGEGNYLPAGNGEFIGTSLDTRSDEDQRADAQEQYRRIIGSLEDAPELQGRDPAKVWGDANDRWRAATGDTEGVGWSELHHLAKVVPVTGR